MARLFGLNRVGGDPYESPREITQSTIPKTMKTSDGDGGGGENGWLIRFFDSAFFCEWIAVSYLYKHEHSGVRDYLCNRMYTLPLSGIESYLFQICYMLLHKPSPSLDKFVIDICSKSLQIALKVNWFLMAELEDSEEDVANEGISRIQEKCQISATLMGEWPPLIVPSSGSSRNRPVIDRLLLSKQRLLSLTSSPSPSPPSASELLQDGHNSNSKGNSDENRLFRKFIPGMKVRDALFFRKSVDKEDEESDKDGFVRRLLREDDEESDKEGIFRRILSKDDDEFEKDGFFRRMLGESKDDEASDKEGFFRRLLRESKDYEGDLSHSSDRFFRRLFRDSFNDSDDKMVGLKSVDDDEKEGFFRRIFKERLEEKKDGNEKMVDEEQLRDDDEKEGFFRRLFKDKNDEKKGLNAKTGNEEKLGDDEEKDKFFHRFFKDRHDKKKDAKEKAEDEEKVEDDDEKEGFFRRIFKEKHEEKKDGSDEKQGEDDEKEGFFRRLFKEKLEEKKDGNVKIEDEEKPGEVDEKEGFFRRLFKEKHEEQKDGSENTRYEKGNRNREEEEPSDFLSFRRLFRVHPEDVKIVTANEISNGGSAFESSPGSENFFRRLFRDREQSLEDSDMFGLRKHKEKRPRSPKQRNGKSYSKPPLPNNVTSQIRKGTYHVSLDFVQSLCETSYNLVDIFPIEDRKRALRESLAEINSHLATAHNCGGVCFPMGKGMYQVVHIPEEEAVLLNSREKAPYMICVEVLKGEVQSNMKETSDAQKLSRGGIPLANRDAQLPKPPPWAYPLWNIRDMHCNGSDRLSISTSQAIDKAMAHLWDAKVKFVHVSLSVEQKMLDCSNSSEDHNLEWVSVVLTAVPGVNMEDVEVHEPARRKDHRRVPSTIAIEEIKAAAAKGEAPLGLPLKGAGQDSSDVQPKVTNGGLRRASDALSGEFWEVKKERIHKTSVYGKSPGWDLRSIIVKSGDDCRQEHLAVQLISHFYDIFQEAGLPLWLRPYEVLVTSSYTALIETIPDTASIHAIKSRFPNITSLRDFFIAKYEENSPNFKLAQRNFVESMAGYSILCYLVQVKDRHNGNLLMDEEGHIIHIDFGFMLSNSPGGVNFESAPFKLTRELLEVMDSDAEGIPSEFFDYFKVLCIQGFLTCRKHAERVILLVEMLQDSGFPCFQGGPRTIQNLRKRFHLSLTEEQCVSLVLSLISSSLDAWRTRQYDYYQRILNGIL